MSEMDAEDLSILLGRAGRSRDALRARRVGLVGASAIDALLRALPQRPATCASNRFA